MKWRNPVDFYDTSSSGNPSLSITLIETELNCSEADLETIMKEMVRLGQDKLVVATGDVHYLDPKDAIYI